MDDRQPRPEEAADAAQFVSLMRQLRQWAHLSYRELERRAEAVGDVLPRATLAGGLNRQELPREELLAAFVRACGGDRNTVESWSAVRRHLAVEAERRTRGIDPAGHALRSGASAAGLSGGGSEPHIALRMASHDAPLPDPDRVGGVNESVAVPEGDVPGPRPGVGDAPVARLPGGESSGPEADASTDAGTERGASTAGPVEAVSQESSSAVGVEELGPSVGPQSAVRRSGLGRRRSSVLLTLLVAALVTVGVSGVILLPDDGAQERKAPPITATATVTASPPNPSRRAPQSADPSQAAASPVGRSEQPPADTPLPSSSMSTALPSASPKPASKSTKPKTSQKPTSQEPMEPEYPPYEPPESSTPPPPWTPPPADSDPFPEETCWDVTNDCF